MNLLRDHDLVGAADRVHHPDAGPALPTPGHGTDLRRPPGHPPFAEDGPLPPPLDPATPGELAR